MQLHKTLVLGILSCFLVVVTSTLYSSSSTLLAQASLVAQRDATPISQTDAATLTQQGFAQFDRGDATSALKLWRSASDQYRKSKNVEGTIGSAINQSLALKALGQYPQMCQILAKEGLGISDRICIRQLQPSQSSFPQALTTLQLSPIRLLALQHFGTALQLIGDLPNAKLALQTVLNRVESNQRSAAQLALGNVERATFIQLRDRFSRSDARETIGNGAIVLKFQAETVLNNYDQSAQDQSTRIKAQLNQISFLADLNRWLLSQKNQDLPEVRQLNIDVIQRLNRLLPVVIKTNFAALSPIDSVYARLNLANSLVHLAQDQKSNNLTDAARLATEALSTAQSLSNTRAISYSFGAIARIEQQQDDLARSRAHFNQAMSLAQSIRASDAAYEWQQALGDIAKKQGDTRSAIAYYSAALNSLDRVRNDLLPIASDVQFSFREQVEPVYRNLMSLLARQATPDLPQIIKTYERLRVAELENFLQCGQFPLTSLSQRRPNAVVFYVLSLDSSNIGVIVQAPGQKAQYYSANAGAITTAINGLTFNLESTPTSKSNLPDEATLKGYSQVLYQQLVAPAQQKGLLQTKTPLIFVLDNTLQNLPVSLLHDGQTYLINRYPIRLSIGSEPDSPSANRRLNALIAALNTASPSFSDPRISQSLAPLTQVKSEVQAISSTVSSTPLLNQQFTLNRLESQIQRNQYNIVHLATHGQFSSVPEDTFLVAWDQLITAPQISVLLRSRSDSPIDLLVLSACQTAKGDTRSTLGLAGIAVQSGARSTLASLWLVDDAATAMLMKNFYANLKQGRSASEALQQAQIEMQRTPYKNPFFWSSFVLVGES